MKNSLITPEIKEIILKEYEKLQSIRKTQNKVNELLNINLTFHNVRDNVQILEDKIDWLKDWLDELNSILEENNKFEVTDDYYIFYQNRINPNWEKEKIKYPIAINTVDAIFKDYSKHGNNLTWDEILQKYEIKPELFFILKNRLRLFKTSHVISPATMERLSDTELQSHIDWAIDEHIKDRYKSKFVKTFEKKKDEDYIKKSKILSNIDYVLEYIRDFLKDYEIKKINPIETKIKNNNHILVWTADWHLGKQKSKNVLKRIEKMTIDLINRDEQYIDIFFWWDTPETLTRGGMHKGQIETMDWPFEFDLLMMCVEEIEKLLISLYNAWKIVRCYWEWGNHWRFTENKQDSLNWIWDLIIYEMVNKSLKNIWIKIELLKETWSNFEFDWMNIITHHGDDWATKKNTANILWEKGKQWVPNIILFSDKHHAEQFDCNSEAIKIIIPSMAWSNVYDKDLLLSSYPWYIIISKNSDWVPDTLIKRFAID